MPAAREPMTRTYRVAMAIAAPVVKWWGRLETKGLEHVPQSGPTLVIANHDSYWDPVAIGVAGRKRRQIRALAKSTLWKIKPLAPILNGMGQVPIERGAGDARALDRAIEHLRAGECIGVFPEGTISRGRVMRARSGFGRLAEAVPGTTIVSCTVSGTVDIVRFPKRPRIRVEFFPPPSGPRRDGESASELSARMMAEIRERAPIAYPGRRRTERKYRQARAVEAAAAEAERPGSG